MADQCCARCGKSLPTGSIKYIVEIQILSDFDGFLPFCDEAQSEEIQRLIKQMEDLEAQELEEEVYQEMSFYLCVQCKKNFADNPFNSEKVVTPPHKKIEKLIH